MIAKQPCMIECCAIPPPQLQVTITVVGIDMLFRVQSRQLMSLKLEQGRVTVEQRAVTRTSGGRRTSWLE